jgi:hypothetical protein
MQALAINNIAQFFGRMGIFRTSLRSGYQIRFNKAKNSTGPCGMDLGFWILEFGVKVRLQRINLLKTDRAKRYNKSAIQNPQSKIAPKILFCRRKPGPPSGL